MSISEQVLDAKSLEFFEVLFVYDKIDFSVQPQRLFKKSDLFFCSKSDQKVGESVIVSICKFSTISVLEKGHISDCFGLRIWGDWVYGMPGEQLSLENLSNGIFSSLLCTYDKKTDFHWKFFQIETCRRFGLLCLWRGLLSH